jgi:mono/diheme cytochrome c family protein
VAAPRVSSLGERIYVLGTGEDGRPVPRNAVGRGMMRRMACATCHGIDGSGGTARMMMQMVVAPDIRYGSLTAPHDEHGDGAASWTDDDIRRAVEEGVEPDGETLDPLMPRWRFTDAEFEALLDYLKELSE